MPKRFISWTNSSFDESAIKQNQTPCLRTRTRTQKTQTHSLSIKFSGPSLLGLGALLMIFKTPKSCALRQQPSKREKCVCFSIFIFIFYFLFFIFYFLFFIFFCYNYFSFSLSSILTLFFSFLLILFFFFRILEKKKLNMT